MSGQRSGGGDIERTLRLLWNPEQAATRGPRRSLTVAGIVDIAVAIADERGLDAVSIRSVATSLDVGTMTLYRYVPSKAELLDLMLDRVNQPGFDELPVGWRPAMEALAHDLWRLYTTHRWLPFVDQARPVLGPNAVHGLDLALGALQPSGLTDQEKVSLIVTIDAFVTTLARNANSMVAAQAQTGVTHEDFWQSQEVALVVAMETGRYQHMAQLSDDAFTATNEEMFEFGLQTILDGVATRLVARASGEESRRR